MFRVPQDYCFSNERIKISASANSSAMNPTAADNPDTLVMSVWQIGQLPSEL
jgi:hypothetical protein